MEKKLIIIKHVTNFSSYSTAPITHRVVNNGVHTAEPMKFDNEVEAAKFIEEKLPMGYYEVRPVYVKPWVDINHIHPDFR